MPENEFATGGFVTKETMEKLAKRLRDVEGSFLSEEAINKIKEHAQLIEKNRIALENGSEISVILSDGVRSKMKEYIIGIDFAKE